MDYGTDRVVCPRCGRNNMPGKATCFGCGRSLLNASPVPLTRIHSKQSPPSRGVPSRKPGLASFVFMVVCCALLATFCIGATFGSLQPKWSDAIWMIGALLVVAITFGLSPLNQVIAIPKMRSRLQEQAGYPLPKRSLRAWSQEESHSVSPQWQMRRDSASSWGRRWF